MGWFYNKIKQGDNVEIINKFRSYLLEEEFSMTVIKNKINIVNYKKIVHFDFNKVIISHENGNIIILGENLVVSKLLNDEVLITGSIKKIELG